MTSTERVRDARPAWITFAAVVLFAVGFLRIISAITYFDSSDDVASLSAGLFGDSLWAWGIWDLAIAALALFAGASLLGGGGFGRDVGYLWGIVVFVQSFLVIEHAPWFAAATIALASLVVYGLAVTSDWPDGG
jgi:hypothetical protein